MKDVLRLPIDLGRAIKKARQDANLSVTEVAKRAGRVRDVIYRIEAGEDATIASLFSVLSVLQLQLRLDKAGMPTLEQVQARFGALEDDE